MSRLALLGGGKATPGAGAPPFVGALDGFSNIAAAYSVRRLLTSYASNLIRLRRDSDDTESNFGYDGDGDLDTAAITTWLGGANGYLKTWYDQSGNGRNQTQNTNANQALYVASGPNSKPTFRADGSNDSYQASFTFNNPQHIFAVAKIISWTSTDILWDGALSLEMALMEWGTPGNVSMYDGTIGIGVALGTTNYHQITAYYASGAGNYHIRVDGAESTDASNVGLNATGITLFARGDLALPSNVDMSEFVAFSALQTEAALESNMETYYGT